MFACNSFPELDEHEHKSTENHQYQLETRLQEIEATAASQLTLPFRQHLVRELDLGVELCTLEDKGKTNEDEEERRDIKSCASTCSSTSNRGETTFLISEDSSTESAKQGHVGLASAVSGPF